MTRNSSSKLNVVLLSFAIVSTGTALWLSPAGDAQSAGAAKPRASAAPAPTTTPTTTPTTPAAPAAPTTGATPAPEPGAGAGAAVRAAGVSWPGGASSGPSSSTTVVRPTVRTTVTAASKPASKPAGKPKIEGCWSFTYQQDAQAAYAKNLSDPLGLDGAKGPFNGDGLACTQLPVDPSRAASKPVGAYVTPAASVKTKAQLVAPATKYFGVAEDGVPGDTALMNTLSTQVGKAPSMVEWFGTWDEEFNATKVQAAWARGALPVISWMPGHKGNKNPADISLQKIVDGQWDDYILRYAGDVVAEGKPVVIRFAHEANGNWYPWSAGGNRRFERGDNGAETFYNTPALYRAAWRHVWSLFEQVGANDEAIWAYTPVSSNGITPNTTDHSQVTYGMTSIAQDYPGDQYVDWVGLSGYSYKETSWSFSKTFSKTLGQLKAVAPSKPILIAETGAAENTGAVSNTERKAAWITDSITGLAADPSVVGFVWFNNTVVDVHTVDGVKITTDNKWDSSPSSLAAFTKAIADPIWSSGRSPDTVVQAGTTAKVAAASTSTGRGSG